MSFPDRLDRESFSAAIVVRQQTPREARRERTKPAKNANLRMAAENGERPRRRAKRRAGAVSGDLCSGRIERNCCEGQQEATCCLSFTSSDKRRTEMTPTTCRGNEKSTKKNERESLQTELPLCDGPQSKSKSHCNSQITAQLSHPRKQACWPSEQRTLT